MNTTTPKPRLVHVTTIANTQFSFLRGQNQYMIQNGFEVHAVSSPGPALRKLAERDSVETHAVPISRSIAPFQDIISLVRLFFLFRHLRPHIVHLSTPKAALLGALAAAAARVPIRIYHIRGLSSESERGLKRTLFQWLERLTARLCHLSLCNAFSLLEYARAENILNQKEGTVLRKGMSNGIDRGRFNPDTTVPISLAKLKPDVAPTESATVIGYVGRIVRDKGIEELVVAWRRLRIEVPHARLLLVGPYERECAISPRVRDELESDPRIIVAGRQEDVVPFYRDMDVFVYPSHGTEGFPNAPMEAAAMRLPVVATRVCGSVDAVVDGVTGVLVQPRDAASLAEAVRAYLTDPELRRRHGQAGRQRVLAEYRCEDIWRELHELYVDLMRRRGLPTPVQVASESTSTMHYSKRRAA